jgi:ribose 5-phosphate isomerase B
MIKKIALACDHAGYEMKIELINYLKFNGYEIEDHGTHSTDSCDYPDFAHPMAQSVEDGKSDIGITLCGSGNGINMVANKHEKIRSALCWEVELAKMARLHNDANVCSLPARYISLEKAKAIIDTFLSTNFEGGRHIARINKIPL